MEFALKYLHYFFEHLVLAWPVLVFLAAIIALLGLIAGRLEGWPGFDSIYWAFITATTVGYGDIRPRNRAGKTLSVLIALIGVTFTGIIVALAINSATLSFKEVHHTSDVQRLIEGE
jgi:voltage-gated potassium channel